MNTATLRQHLEMETEGELTPMQWRTYAYVEPIALEYRAGVQVPPPSGEAPRADAAQPHVAPARREACAASFVSEPDEDDLDGGLPRLVGRLARVDEERLPIPSLNTRQAD